MVSRRKQFVWHRSLLLAFAVTLSASATLAATDAGSLSKRLHQANFAPSDESFGEPIDLARQTFLAENLAPAVIEWHLARLSKLAAQLAATGSVAGSDLDKTAAIHRFMYAQVLSGDYHADAHSLAELLDSGRYNCLSATLLLVVLAARYELPLVAVESPGHITAGLLQGDDITVVETTLPLWRPEHATKQPQLAESDERPISRRQLLAAVHYNRGWQLLRAGDFAAAVSANAEALRLDRQCTAAHKNLLASLNNWAVALCAAKQYTQALEVLRAGQAIDGTFAPFEANRQHVLRCAVQAVDRSNRAAK